MKTLAIYHASVPNKKNAEKTGCLRHFATGAQMCGDQIFNISGYEIRPVDVAVIQGWITDDTVRPHLNLRQRVIQSQLSSGGHVVTADSNLFLYADRDNPHHYLRYSFDGVFPTTGNYCDSRVDPERWRTVSRVLDIQVKPWREYGQHIVLCLQRNGGWSMGKYHVLDWAADVILELRQHTDREIVVRPHPGDRHAREYLGDFAGHSGLKGVTLSKPGATLVSDLQGAWAAVAHNSSPTVGAAIEGVPVFVTDPARSQCRDIANTDLSMIESPSAPDRQAWLERIAMSHWSFAELQRGEAWQWMRRFIP